ncbi:FxsA family membrane protein [Streptomyces sp. NPDC057638]|uniref:FxsA family membrane protein n=1 Tax=Streptomyces sp. NPDC057638 TaxID=3346190 RepID=UPI003678B901
MTTGAMPPTTPKRSRARRITPLAILAWLVLEIWLLALVAQATGALTVLALLIGGAVVGGAVIKRAGRRAFQSLSETLQRAQAGEVPQAPPAGEGNGFLMLAGLLLMIPGLISDAVGLVLLVPPVRAALARYAERSLERRMRAASPGSLGDAFQQARIHRPDGKVVPGEVIDPDRPDHPRGGAYGDGGRSSGDGPRPPLTP